MVGHLLPGNAHERERAIAMASRRYASLVDGSLIDATRRYASESHISASPGHCSQAFRASSPQASDCADRVPGNTRRRYPSALSTRGE